MSPQAIKFTLDEHLEGLRLDLALSKQLPDYSRGQLQAWIKQGLVTCNGQTCKVRQAVKEGDEILVEIPQVPVLEAKPESVAFEILFEDDQVLVINKPVGLVVHPGNGVPDGTLMNGILHHCLEADQLPRAGIVHRLDKDTSGVMVVAKTLPAHTSLVKQLQARSVSRVYHAVVLGHFTGPGLVDSPIGRHPVHRTKMAVQRHSGKPAVTHYRVLERFERHSSLELKLETGRTHQIRVHMSHIGHPLVGDKVYGGRLVVPKGCSQALLDMLRTFPRQALHAKSLTFMHPVSSEPVSFDCPVPEDILELEAMLRA